MSAAQARRQGGPLFGENGPLMREIVCLLLLLLLFLASANAEEVRLFLVHTNDIHGHLESTQGTVNSGGFVRVATVIRTLKAAFPGHVLVLDGGDLALGTPTSGLFFGLPTAEAMRSVGYDAIAIGNHEFDWGQDAMAKFLKATGAPILCANLVNSSDGSHPYAPSVVLEKAGARLAIVGLVAPDTATRTPEAYTRGWTFQAAEPAMRSALAELPPVDAVIALTHIGEKEDRALARVRFAPSEDLIDRVGKPIRAVPRLDLIVGGHSHTALQDVVWENNVPIVQSGCYCQFVGVMEIVVDTEADRLRVVSYHLVPTDSTIAPDPEVQAIVDGYDAKVRPILDRVIGQVGAEVQNTPAKAELDRPLGDLIADMLRAETGADVAFYNRGGVRGYLPAGPLAVRTLHEMFPFDDNIVLLQVSGARLAQIVEQGVQTQANLSPSGLKAIIDSHGKASIEVAGQPLKPEGTYTLATTNFLATGGDKMETLVATTRLKTFPFTREVVQSYIEKHPAIAAPSTGRIKKL